MADDNKIVVSIVLDDGTIRQGFANIQENAKSTFANIAETAAGVFAGQALLGAFETIKNAARDLFEDTIRSASEGDQAVQRLNTSLAISGRFTTEASKQFQEFADKIQATTTVSDDQVLALESLASTYSKTNAQALKLTQASIDLAAVTGNDVNTAMIQLSGTLSGHAGRLTRLFPELARFTQSQLEAGAAVDYFNSRFSGAAAAEANTFSGRITILKNEFEDLLKTLGRYITRSPAVIATIGQISEVVQSVTSSISGALSDTDFFKSFIINFSVLAQTGTETARRIGLSFELAFLRAKEAFLAFKVLSTAGFSDAFNQQLSDVMDQIELVKNEFTEDSAITKFFDKLIGKLQETNGALTSLNTADIQNHMRAAVEPVNELSGAVESLDDATANFSLGFTDAALMIAGDARKAFQDQGAAAIRSFSNSVASGMAAVGKALVKGQDIFQAFAGAFLGAIGQAMIAEGGARILQGLARWFGSYGLDPTAQALIATGSAMTVAGGALTAIGDGGVTGVSSPSTSISTGGGSAIANPDVTPDPSTSVGTTAAAQPTITVHIAGDVLDSRESGLRIIELINDQFNSSGARVFAT